MKLIRNNLILFSSLGILVYGCAKSDGSGSGSTTDTSSTYSRSNTPAKSSVSVPASLSGSGSASRTANQEISSVFYSMLKAGVMMMKSSVSNADLNLMLADVRMADSTKGTCYDVGDYSLTFTQAMYNNLRNMEQDFGGTEGAEGSMTAQFKSKIGTTINPPVAYEINDINEGGYNSELKVGSSCTNDDVTASGAETFRWDSAKKKLQVAFDDSSGGTTMKGSFSYDDDKKKSSINMTYDDGSNAMKMTMNLSTCSDSQSSGMSGDCAIYSFTQSFSDSTYGQSMMKGSGKADDKGGYGEAKMSMTYNGSDMSIEYKENWNGAGTVTYAAIKQGGSWTTVGGEPDTTYDESSFDSQPYSITVTVSGSSYTTKGSYHLVLDGKDPNSAPESIVGYGEIRGSDTFWDFWGGDASATLDLWTIPSSGDMTEVTGASITVTAN